MNPSARLFSEKAKPMFEISCALYAALVACISSMIRFSLVIDRLLMISNNDFESVIKCIGIVRERVCSSCDRSAQSIIQF